MKVRFLDSSSGLSHTLGLVIMANVCTLSSETHVFVVKRHKAAPMVKLSCKFSRQLSLLCVGDRLIK